jgi:hypothetical protein
VANHRIPWRWGVLCTCVKGESRKFARQPLPELSHDHCRYGAHLRPYYLVLTICRPQWHHKLLYNMPRALSNDKLVDLLGLFISSRSLCFHTKPTVTYTATDSGVESCPSFVTHQVVDPGTQECAPNISLCATLARTTLLNSPSPRAASYIFPRNRVPVLRGLRGRGNLITATVINIIFPLKICADDVPLPQPGYYDLLHLPMFYITHESGVHARQPTCDLDARPMHSISCPDSSVHIDMGRSLLFD